MQVGVLRVFQAEGGRAPHGLHGAPGQFLCKQHELLPQGLLPKSSCRLGHASCCWVIPVLACEHLPQDMHQEAYTDTAKSLGKGGEEE